MKRDYSKIFTDNLSYKIVSLFIALVLWLTILGRRDFVSSKTVEVDLIAAPGYTVMAQTADQIKVKVSGPRTALKKYLDNAMNSAIAINIADRAPGIVEIEVPINKIEVPMGVKIIGVRPNRIRAEIVKTEAK